MRDYLEYVNALSSLMNEAESTRQPLAEDTKDAKSANKTLGQPVALLFSPHPDDEMITGALPLRLLRQKAMRVINVAVTLGSNKKRQQERLQELKSACNYAGFELELSCPPNGLGNVKVDSANSAPSHWDHAVKTIGSIIEKYSPKVVFFPHALDANSTHMGVNALVMDALKTTAHPCHCVETEFWAPMSSPNLLVQSSPEELATLIAALSLHTGEVSRNPYHLSLPMWMVDNVRRGAEIIGSEGGKAPSFRFGTLYRHSFWDGAKLQTVDYAGSSGFKGTGSSFDKLMK